MQMPISSRTAIPSNTMFQIAQPQPQPQPAVQSNSTQSNAMWNSGEPFSVGRNDDKNKGSVRRTR